MSAATKFSSQNLALNIFVRWVFSPVLHALGGQDAHPTRKRFKR